MRQIIPLDREPSCRGYAVESDEAAGLVILEGDGVVHWFGPGEPRRIGRSPHPAAGAVERAGRAWDGGGSAPDDDLPDLY